MRDENEREQEKRDGDVQPGEEEFTATPLTDRLAELADRAGGAFRTVRARSVSAAQAYLDCGSILVEAKAGCGHGEWLSFLARADIPERTAQRMMKLAESGKSAETLAEKGVKVALAEKVRRCKNDTVTDLEGGATPKETRSQVFRALHTKLEEAAKEGRGARLKPRDVSALVARLSRPRPRAGNGSDDTFLSTEFVKRALGLQRPSSQVIRVLERLYDAHPGSLSTNEVHDPTDCTEQQFEDLIRGFLRGIEDTDGYEKGRPFFEWGMDDKNYVRSWRLPDSVRRALEEEFPNNFLAPDNDVDESGSTAGPDGNPS